MCHLLPFIHAFSGCDTVSRIYGIGKALVLKKTAADKSFQQKAEVFMRYSTPIAIEKAGERIVASLYNGKPDEDLNTLRYRRFVQKVNTATTVNQVQTLPTTQASAKFHSYRAYLQVQIWIGNTCNPTEWGWCESNERL